MKDNLKFLGMYVVIGVLIGVILTWLILEAPIIMCMIVWAGFTFGLGMFLTSLFKK